MTTEIVETRHPTFDEVHASHGEVQAVRKPARQTEARQANAQQQSACRCEHNDSEQQLTQRCGRQMTQTRGRRGRSPPAPFVAAAAREQSRPAASNGGRDSKTRQFPRSTAKQENSNFRPQAPDEPVRRGARFRAEPAPAQRTVKMQAEQQSRVSQTTSASQGQQDLGAHRSFVALHLQISLLALQQSRGRLSLV
jgi:hypothetical protein